MSGDLQFLGELFQPMPAEAEHWEEFKKLAIAAERHRLESLSDRSGTDSTHEPATVPDHPEKPLENQGEKQ